MLDLERLTHLLGVAVLVAPALLVVFLGGLSLLDARVSERFTIRVLQTAVTAALLAAIGVLGLMLYRGVVHVPIKLLDWVLLHDADGHHLYHFVFKIVFDRLSTAFVILSLVLCAVVGSFSTRYMHREPGFNRFFVLYALFVLGMVTASLADTIETLFAGWELVGLSSALLVGFFQDRVNPVRNGLWVWVVYRFADAALLLAAVVLHHTTGGGDFDLLMGEGPWPAGTPAVASHEALLVGMLLLIAAAGKSALVPFSGWLPRAMEGPTTSSAVFYGALSVHLGVFLLLRVGPLLAHSAMLSAAVLALGLMTAIFAALAGSVQTDIKSALAFASLSQVGIIVAEIGLCFYWLPPVFRWLPLVHLIGHACLRTLQFLRAPMLLQDYQRLENAIGGRLPGPAGRIGQTVLPGGARNWLYRVAMERGTLDTLLSDWVARPFVQLFLWLDRCERRWASLLSGEREAGQT